MPACQGPPAGLPVHRQALVGEVLDLDRGLAVPELAHVEVPVLAVERRQVVPAEQVVARGLHQPLPLDDPVSLALVRRRTRVRGEHRRLGLLQLEQQRVARVPALHQHDPGAGPDAADPHDLAGQRDEPVALHQHAALRRQAGAVLVQEGLDDLDVALPCLADQHLLGGHQHRRVRDELRLAVHDVQVPLERVQVVAAQRLLEPLLRLLGAGPVGQGPEPLLQVRRRHACVPDVQVAHLGELEHGLAVRLHGRHHDVLPLDLVEPEVPPGDLHRCGEALQVPLDGAGQGLVEVVQTEDERALGCVEDAEVQQVRITAQLGAQSCGRRRRQVGGHDARAATEEGEGRHQHPAVADRHQLGGPSSGLALEDGDGILAGRQRVPRREGLEGDLRPTSATAGLTFGDALRLEVLGVGQRVRGVRCLVHRGRLLGFGDGGYRRSVRRNQVKAM